MGGGTGRPVEGEWGEGATTRPSGGGGKRRRANQSASGESDGFERMQMRGYGKCVFERVKIERRLVLIKKNPLFFKEKWFSLNK